MLGKFWQIVLLSQKLDRDFGVRAGPTDSRPAPRPWSARRPGRFDLVPHELGELLGDPAPARAWGPISFAGCLIQLMFTLAQTGRAGKDNVAYLF